MGIEPMSQDYKSNDHPHRLAFCAVCASNIQQFHVQQNTTGFAKFN